MTVECDACSISIGEGFIEQTAYPVGDKTICGDCLKQLQLRGRLQIGNRKGSLLKETALYLHPDGQLEREKVMR